MYFVKIIEWSRDCVYMPEVTTLVPVRVDGVPGKIRRTGIDRDHIIPWKVDVI